MCVYEKKEAKYFATALYSIHAAHGKEVKHHSAIL